ncbi:conserved exported hypothetical protein [Burkholderiales bacterium 8X]|nr:conserved exported hypothetical protein [Burkholderiales bacterium 8X]
MSKVLSTLLATLVVAGAAHAQSNPPGAAVPPNSPGFAGGKSEQAGEARKNNRPATGVRAPAGGDINRTPEGGAIGNDRAAMAGEKRAETRDMRRPGHTPSKQGGTPK